MPIIINHKVDDNMYIPISMYINVQKLIKIL